MQYRLGFYRLAVAEGDIAGQAQVWSRACEHERAAIEEWQAS